MAKMTTAFFSEVKMACNYCRSRKARCEPASSSTCVRCLDGKRQCVYQRRTQQEREEDQRQRNAAKRGRRASCASVEESSSSSSSEYEEDEEYSEEDEKSIESSSLASIESVGRETVKELDAGNSREAQARSIPRGQPGFAEEAERTLSAESTSPPPKRRKPSTRSSCGTLPIRSSVSSDRQCLVPARAVQLASSARTKGPISETESSMSTSRPASSRGHAYSMPPPPSPHLDESAKLKSQKTILRVHLVGESKHKILSLRKCSRAKSLFSKLATTWAVKEQDVKKLCFTFNWKAHRDSERTLELEDEFDIIGADYLFELIKDAPCWSEPSGSVTGRCIIDVKMFVSRTQAEETFWPRSPEL